MEEGREKGAHLVSIVNVDRQPGGARQRQRHLHAHRAGDRRGVDQGVHRVAGRSISAGGLSRQAARHLFRRSGAAACWMTWRSSRRWLVRCWIKCITSSTRSWRRPSSNTATSCTWAAGINYPIALEGALKLKEISYIHAEGYPAGEMKHGPIALIDEHMPVVAIAPQDRVYDKMISQIEQVKARGGIVIAVANEGDDFIATKADHVLYVPQGVRAADAGADRDPAATAGVPHRRPPRRGRGSAAQPGEERDGGVANPSTRRTRPACGA